MASRMGYNLFHRHGWKHLLFSVRTGHVHWPFVYMDTVKYPLLGLVCRVRGHVPTLGNTFGDDPHCLRCNRWLPKAKA